jgi:hypothetical protein
MNVLSDKGHYTLRVTLSLIITSWRHSCRRFQVPRINICTSSMSLLRNYQLKRSSESSRVSVPLADQPVPVAFCCGTNCASVRMRG